MRITTCNNVRSLFCSPRDTPCLVLGLSGKKVVSVAAGSMHSAAVTDEGAVYTWGRGSYGRLGHGEASGLLGVCETERGVHVCTCSTVHVHVCVHIVQYMYMYVCMYMYMYIQCECTT